MNLNCVKELVDLYRNSNETIDVIKLRAVYLKLNPKKLTDSTRKSRSKSNNTNASASTAKASHLASQCWSLLVLINKHTSNSFLHSEVFFLTAYFVVECSKVIEGVESSLRMGPFDLDKLLANLVTKLTEGCRGSVIRYMETVELSDHLFSLLEFIFKRLRREEDEEEKDEKSHRLEGKIRRLSLVEEIDLENPFIGSKFKIEQKENCDDDDVNVVLLQLIVIALESLVKLTLIYSMGPIDAILADLHFFYRRFLRLDSIGAKRNILQFISSVCKLEFWTEIEWNFWIWIFEFEGADCGDFPQESHVYFKRRLLLKLNFTPPATSSSVKSSKMIGLLLSSGLFTEISFNELDRFDGINLNFEVVIGLLSILAKEAEKENVYYKKIESIFTRINSNSLNYQAEQNLNSLLAALDAVRNELFRLIRSDEFILILLQLNVFLFKTFKIPDKYYISWSSFVMKSVIEGGGRDKKKQFDCILKCSITDLLEILQKLTASSDSDSDSGTTEELKVKTIRLICQSIGFVADVEILKRFDETLVISKKFLLIILQNSAYNLCRDYFTELSRLSVHGTDCDDDVLIAWTNVLKSQLHVTKSVFLFSDIAIGRKMLKFLAIHVIDDLKFEQFADFVNERLVELGLSVDFVYLNYFLTVLKYKTNKNNWIFSSFKYTFTDPKFNLLTALIQSKNNNNLSEATSSQVFILENDENPLHEIEIELYDYFLNLLFINFNVDPLLSFLTQNFQVRGTIKERILYQLREQGTADTETEVKNENITVIHDLYLQYKYEDALKLGYEVLKRKFNSKTSTADVCIDETFEVFELISYLFKLSITTRNLSEAKYFLKQLSELSRAFNDVGLINFTFDRFQKEFDILIGKFEINYLNCEQILTSSAYSIFSHEYNSLMELKIIRKSVCALFPTSSSFSIVTNGIKIKSFHKMDQLERLMKISSEELKRAQQGKLYYCIGEWAKIVLSLKFIQSAIDDNENNCECADLELLKYFELSRRPEYSDSYSFNDINQKRISEGKSIRSSYSGSVGLLYDQMSSIFWIFIINLQSKLVVIRFPIEISTQINRLIQITCENTETLRNTRNLDEAQKINWWKTRKSLDFELIQLCQNLSESLFLNFQELIFPSDSSSNSKNLLGNLNKFVNIKFPSLNLKFSAEFAVQLCLFGSCPKRGSIEFIMKLLNSSKSLSSIQQSQSQSDAPQCTEESSHESFDKIVFDLRKCFENSFNLGSIFETSENYENCENCYHSKPLPFNLLLDKDLNKIPFESFPSFIKYSFKRIPRILNTIHSPIDHKNTTSDNDNLNTVFYIINPSGDLTQTQDRFQNLFLNQQNWNGIIGRRPSPDEFFAAINGKYDLFIYFGHSGGEIYAPLKELKSKIKIADTQKASSVLLIGCSSGKIKSNAVFPADSAIFHYLDNKSPLILANLWDVTDKDIDIFIKNVMEESFILKNDNTKADYNLQSKTKHTLLIENTQSSRGKCHLSGLNGFAPIIYGVF